MALHQREHCFAGEHDDLAVQVVQSANYSKLIVDLRKALEEAEQVAQNF